LQSIERIGLGAGYSYHLTMDDGNVANGQALAIMGSGVTSSLIFDGSAESDGRFVFYGGAGTTDFTGGDKSDTVFVGAGATTLHYTSAAQSTSTTYDTVSGFDFGQDHFDVAGSVTSVTELSGFALYVATFNAQLEASALLTSALIGAGDDHGAALLHVGSGNLTGKTFLVVDQNGTAGYQQGSDLVIRLDNATNTNSFSTGNFG
jgi:hypothetical protein